MIKSINEIQDNIILNFSMFQNDIESIIFYIMDLGKKLPKLDIKYKNNVNLIYGCQSQVWLISKIIKFNRIKYYADSDSIFTKGLISLLVSIFDKQTPEDIIHANIYFTKNINIYTIIGTQRSNGLKSMIYQIKKHAELYNNKNNI